ncbi:MAG TPA: tetratricopeptide repeat protein [Sphaerochaeta sp.]|nr:tetratricopeptide repeat protein [Sphaerochaeta sp.]
MDPIAWYYQRRSLNAMVQNKWEEAEGFLLKQIAREGSSMGLQYNLALIYLGQERMQEAYDTLLNCADTYGESLRLTRMLGDIQYIHGKRLDALKWYKAALEDSPDAKEAKLISLRVLVLEDEQRYQKVLANQADVEQARLLFSTKPDQALALYLRVVEDDPSHVEALNNLGSLYLDEFDDAKRAESYFEQVLELVDSTAAAKNLAKARKVKS